MSSTRSKALGPTRASRCALRRSSFLRAAKLTTLAQIINSTPVWARIYYLVRTGHPQKALAFAIENEQHIQKLETTFVTYFKKWLEAPDHR